MPSSSQYDLRQGTPGRESYYEPPLGQNAPSGGPRQRYPRTASEPQFHSAYKQSEQQNAHPVPNNHRSYETVDSGSGSGISGEPAGYQTDPTSSDNSSIERVQSPAKKPEPSNDYGIAFNQSPTYQPSAFVIGVKSPGLQRSPLAVQMQNAPGPGPANALPVPRKDNVILRKPARQPSVDIVQQRPLVDEKRKSWFARRFSRQG